MTARRRLGLLAALAAAGCLPAGDPPQGQHLLKGRDNAFVRFQPVGPGEPARLLTLRDSTDYTGPVVFQKTALYDLTAPDPATGNAQQRLLLDGVLASDDGCYGCGYAYDARGRLLLPQQGSDPFLGLTVHLVRVDPEKDERTDLGDVSKASLSTDRTLLLITTQDTGSSETTVLARVRDLDDRETSLPPAVAAEMVGNDVYFVSKDQKLYRVRGTALAAEPELVADQVGNFFFLETGRGPLLVLARPAPKDAFVTTHALFEPATSQVLPVPGETEAVQFAQPFPSPDGRFLFFSLYDGRSGLRVSVLDRDTGMARAQETANLFTSHWRPGHDEIWLQTSTGVLRWKDGGELEPLPDIRIAEAAVRPNFSIFTPDGRSFISAGNPYGLGSADDPTAEPLAIGSKGTRVASYWPLPDGRGIAEVYTTFQMHADLVLVDPVARSTKTLGTGGWVIAVGARHALAYVDWVKSTSSGTLTLIDLDTGALTVLGENVHSVALEAHPAKLDRLPPGARVAFLVRHRIASPYDGVWMTTLP
jgi:hypothetical protein